MNDRSLEETREFFAARAATWEEKYPDDGPAFAAAIAEMALPAGGWSSTPDVEPAARSPCCGTRSGPPGTWWAWTSPRR
ncbi:hypothetical protein GCM10027612_12920 [Microbispora bryophytorum subsp. camponoti]